MHSIDVGPDLDFLCTNSCTDQRSCVIASTALQVVDLIPVIPANVSLCNDDVDIAQRTDQWFESLADLFEFRLFVLRSEEHTSELQSRENLVCRLLLEKKKMA